IESQGQKACHVSDLIPTAIHLDLLWIMAYDLFPMEIIANKKRFYDEAIPGRWLVIFTHDPAIPWGYVKEIGTGKYGVEPITGP
ncbi:MAG TPA: MBL fold metallo-hydrolase, partial [Terriglobales bacterium]|nr:MBL fold metallo-hydrolase [Terriglobales bacterium]